MWWLELQPVKGKGRGVFAAKDFEKGETVEICPVVVLPKKDIEHIDKTDLERYYFIWTEDKIAICLGYGSIYNHSMNPNCDFDLDHDKMVIVFTAIKDIAKGEEMTFSYGLDLHEQPPWYNKC
jgi:uncharacterized protein